MPWTPLILDDKQLKHPFWLTVVPDDMLPFIGHVTVLWGFYEDMFDEYLATMIRASGVEPAEGWRKLSYRNRRTIFKKQAKLCFSKYPLILNYITEIMTDSLPLQRERNLLTHGRIAATAGDYDDVIHATSIVKGKPVTIIITEPMLSRLFHDLGHLAGRLQYLQDPRDESDDEQNLPLKQPERSALLAFWKKHYRTPANAAMPKPPRPVGRG